MTLAEQLAKYLADTTEKYGAYYEVPDEPTDCVAVLDMPNNLGAPPQIDAATHSIMVIARSKTNTAAEALAKKCYDSLCSDTGFIDLEEDSVYVWLFCKPTWEKMDQQKRKYFAFKALITTKR